jgi:hypothetical protein
MFQIRVSLGRETTLTGLEALDERRRLGLPDNGVLVLIDATDPVSEVSEGFARAHFTDRTVNDWTRVVSPAQLCPGDLVEDAPGSVKVRLNQGMPAERVTELWLAGTEVE